ncbi:MAG: glycosyltransferase family 4 protein [Pseudomonadales bacterium]|jgi:glycosyltransferase involved in cell wall biosynthesis|nr:glycosyltransferase family 4 protein [Pseudomonadales bacterium]
MKPKLLLVSAISPFPKTSGGAVRIFNTIKYLSVKFEIHLVFWQDQDCKLSEEEEVFLNKHAASWTTIPLWYKQKLSWWSYGQPFWFSEWFDPEACFLINALIKKHQIKNVQIDCTQLLYLQKYLPSSVKTNFVAYDISTTTFWRRLVETKNLRRIAVFFWRWLEVYKYEKKYLPKYNMVTAMSEHDADLLENKFDVEKILIVPNGLENLEALPMTTGSIINLGYIGGFAHTPNERAVKYFIKKVAPLLEKQRINYRYYIAGENNDVLIKKWMKQARLKNPEKIVNLGRVGDVEYFYKKIDILLVTLFSGSGTRVKVLEALGYGRKVIGTSVGVEGIDAQAMKIDVVNERGQMVEKIEAFDKKEWSPAMNNVEQMLWSKIIDRP